MPRRRGSKKQGRASTTGADLGLPLTANDSLADSVGDRVETPNGQLPDEESGNSANIAKAAEMTEKTVSEQARDEEVDENSDNIAKTAQTTEKAGDDALEQISDESIVVVEPESEAIGVGVPSDHECSRQEGNDVAQDDPKDDSEVNDPLNLETVVKTISRRRSSHNDDVSEQALQALDEMVAQASNADVASFSNDADSAEKGQGGGMLMEPPKFGPLGVANAGGGKALRQNAKYDCFWDVVAVSIFSGLMVMCWEISWFGWIFFPVAFICAVVWRLRNKGVAVQFKGLPYTCGYVSVDGRQLFVAATLHIAPRSPEDVKEILKVVKPDVVMIELDDQRLDDMRVPVTRPTPNDLQPVTMTIDGEESRIVQAMRTDWNGEFENKVVVGKAHWDINDTYGLSKEGGPEFKGNIAVALTGAPNQQKVTLSMKAHLAAAKGAKALLVLCARETFPKTSRLGMSLPKDDFKVVCQFKSCGYPPIPVLMVRGEDAQNLARACRPGNPRATLQFAVKADKYPRQTMRRKICQAAAMMMSGIDLLYRVIECFNIEAGDEFVTAEKAAKQSGVPCVCVDFDDNELCSTLAKMVIPTPENIYRSIVAWLCFPRICWQTMFPTYGMVDTFGTAFLLVKSFKGRTWVAMTLAVILSSAVVFLVLFLTGAFAEQAVSAAVHKKTDDVDHLLWILYIIVGAQIYVLPRLWAAACDARDEGMYQGIVNNVRNTEHKRIVMVCGAAHANGILLRARTRGLQ